MSREDYLSELYGRLRQRIPEKELENIMKYYEEYFDEAGPERESEIMAELGSAEDLTRQVLAGRGVNTGSENYRYERQVYRRDWTAGKVILLICLFPIWLPLLLAIPLAMFSLVLGVGVGGLGVIAGGLFMGWCGFTAIFTPGLPTTMFFGGLGILIIALGLLMLAGAVALGRVCGKGTAAMCRWLFVGGRRGAAV